MRRLNGYLRTGSRLSRSRFRRVGRSAGDRPCSTIFTVHRVCRSIDNGCVCERRRFFVISNSNRAFALRLHGRQAALSEEVLATLQRGTPARVPSWIVALDVSHARRYYFACGDQDVQVCRHRSSVPATARGALRQHRAPGAAQVEAARPRATHRGLARAAGESAGTTEGRSCRRMEHPRERSVPRLFSLDGC